MTPLSFIPYLRAMPWGGERLGRVLHKPVATSQRIGESWEISDHRLHESVVADGPWRGRSLRDLMEQERDSLLGAAAPRYRRFPWLVKFLDANDWLSVQLHPNDEQATRLAPTEGGKTEAWFVLDADPGSRIYAGLRKGVGERELRQALERGTVVDCLHSFEPRAGDCVFLPAGTVHAVGKGILLAELQQNSDATFRLFDWGRRDAAGKSRPLHIEESLACIDWTSTEVHPLHVEKFASRRVLVDCLHFRVEYLSETEPCDLGGMGKMQVMQVVAGQGALGERQVELGQSWLLPASMPAQRLVPDKSLAVLLSTLP
jgi:mannose-6-phosphate isomerase